MGGGPFFRAGHADFLVKACLDLALTFRCDPYTFLDRPAGEVVALWDRTMKHLEETGPQSDDA